MCVCLCPSILVQCVCVSFCVFIQTTTPLPGRGKETTNKIYWDWIIKVSVRQTSMRSDDDLRKALQMTSLSLEMVFSLLKLSIVSMVTPAVTVKETIFQPMKYKWLIPILLHLCMGIGYCCHKYTLWITVINIRIIICIHTNITSVSQQERVGKHLLSLHL